MIKMRKLANITGFEIDAYESSPEDGETVAQLLMSLARLLKRETKKQAKGLEPTVIALTVTYDVGIPYATIVLEPALLHAGVDVE